MSIKQAEEFLKKVGHRKNVSKFEKYKEEIVYLYNQNATLEVITQFLETKGVKRTKGYNALSSYIKRNLVDDIMSQKSAVKASTEHTLPKTVSTEHNNKNKKRTFSTDAAKKTYKTTVEKKV